MAQWLEGKQKILLAFMIREPQFYEVLSHRIGVQQIYNRHLHEFSVILYAVNRFYEEHKELPESREIFLPTLEEAIHHFPELEDHEHVVQRIHSWADYIFSFPQELIESERKKGLRLFYSFVNDYSTKAKLLALANSDYSPVQLREEILLLSQELGSLFKDDRPTMLRPALEPEKYLSGLKVKHSNVWVWGELFGGLRPSELYCILGPTGGGKSLLAVHVAADAARDGPVYFATYEERVAKPADDTKGDGGPLRSELLIRVLGSIEDFSRSEFDGFASVPGQDIKTFDQLPKDMQQKALELKNEPIAQNLEFYDYKALGYHASTLSALLHNVRARLEEGPIELFVIDPFWPLVMRTCMALDIPLDPPKMRGVGQMMAETLHEFCQETRVPLILVHQLGASSAAPKGSRPTSYGAAEIRTIAWRFENVVAITRPDNYGRVALIRAKSRYSGEMNQMVKAILDGDTNQFREPQEGMGGAFSEAEQLIDPSGKKMMVQEADQIAEIVIGKELPNAKS